MSAFEDAFFMNIAPVPSFEGGMCRIVAGLDGERIVRADPHIGFMHKGLEKLAETTGVLQGACLCGRLNYAFPCVCEYPYVLAVEKLAGIRIPERAAYIRALCAELSRIASHFRALARCAADCGASAGLRVADDVSEALFFFFSRLCGSARPSAFFRPGGVRNDLPRGLGDKIAFWIEKRLPARVRDIERLTVRNRIFKSRTRGIGTVGGEDAEAAGFSGVNLRASGRAFDLRRAEPYDAYKNLEFDVPVGTAGDAYTRCVLRVMEIRQSAALALQALSKMPAGEVLAPEMRLSVDRGDGSVEAEASRFKLLSDGFPLPEGEVCVATEAPWGELGVYLVSDGSSVPYRCRFRSAGFPHLQAAARILEGASLSDVGPVLSSLDIIMTEVDR